ncbi:MAG: glutathione S-transferase family protein [Pseudomonadota bacterium]
MTITFYTNPMSRGQIARWALHEAGAVYEEHIMGYGTDMKGPEYLKLNPMGKVPTIVHDGNVVTEAAAICLYLAEVFPEAKLKPAAKSELADYLRWTFFGAGPVEQALVAHAMKWDEKLANDAKMQGTVGFGSYDSVVDALDALFTQRAYVCGNQFTAADIYLGAQVDWGLMFKTLQERPSFVAYAERLRTRDAYRAAKAIDGAHIAKMQAAEAG